MNMDNLKIILRENKKYGKSLFAKKAINKGEIIAVFDGQVYEANKCSDLPNEAPLKVRDHAIQFEKHKWRDSNGLARFISHSCEPNCGIKESFKIVAIKDIPNGEELTYDYDMTENSDWKLICKCDSANCRKLIRGYRFLPSEFKKKYRGFISKWLIE
ncbi:hypothetical protein CMI38_00420 [Candidatus Pacearchaeota archaeon]|jgi:hypothetical protein|nr:hypothetical protein [Candidatus Pacearchaeota archaeon]|tara:strand:- start:2173 stop:2646 length:474 start_codon:yes stop_codon:yes gene_type:complete